MKIKALILPALLMITTLFSSFSFAEKVWIDVRTLVENQKDNIKGDLRISHSNIVREVRTLYPDINTEFYLYDNTGGRSDIAISALDQAGYKNLHNAGSIEEAREQRGIK
ncbi:rhodanese-like domain-containing protein [Psychromonas arctica]|uniref:Rhodanese-like domain-containing protein n=1 Tax=Psychromonas arctica TaxID=168275 RepID=A0ABU9HBL9_9GAMM|nr:rhodanese-like domain-containing protein [Psychromonas sp. L1A2]